MIRGRSCIRICYDFNAAHSILNGTFVYTLTNLGKPGFYNVSASTVSGRLTEHSWTGFEMERNNPAIFITNLTSGDRAVYQMTTIISYEFPNGKKLNIGSGDKGIPISGTVTDISANYSNPMRKLDLIVTSIPFDITAMTFKPIMKQSIIDKLS
jgi:hypothetical protein